MLYRKASICLLIIICLIAGGCDTSAYEDIEEKYQIEDVSSSTSTDTNSEDISLVTGDETQKSFFKLEAVPDYSGAPYIEINNNQPYFKDEKFDNDGYESYSDLDGLGRCGVAFACVTKDTMSTEPRGEKTLLLCVLLQCTAAYHY